MNRQIKFRVWNLFLNKWEPDLKLSSRGHLFPTVGSINNDDLILQFSTGILDQNGKEVFDGDILLVKQNKHCEHKSVVEWGDIGWTALTPNRSNVFIWMDCYESVQVIGNVFENPEL